MTERKLVLAATRACISSGHDVHVYWLDTVVADDLDVVEGVILVGDSRRQVDAFGDDMLECLTCGWSVALPKEDPIHEYV